MLCMLLRSRKQLPEMVRPPLIPNTAASNAASGTATNPPTSFGGTQAILSSTTTTALETIESTMAMPTTQAIPTGATIPGQTTQVVPAFFNLGTSCRNMPYGMPTSLMQGLHMNPSSFSESLNVPMPQLFTPGVSIPFETPQKTLTNASMMALRQQMDEANHDMTNLVTQQMGAVINHLIRDSNNS
jgi:hypothetical protein